MTKVPSRARVQEAWREIRDEDRAELERVHELLRGVDESLDNLPSEHPDHCCGVLCDGQDGSNSHCARLRRKLFGGGR